MTRQLIGGIVLLILAVSPAAAQDSSAAPRDSQPGMRAGGGMSMMVADSLNHRLDTLVSRMNRASGNKKVEAMAAVINELVDQRKTMMSRMHGQMGGMMRGNMMGAPDAAPSPAAKPDSSAADTADHAAHHPPQ